jgi:acyl carrier protein
VSHPNEELVQKCFSEALGIPLEQVSDELSYDSIPEWDSVSHMALIAMLEDKFNILLETNDILEMSSVKKAKEIFVRLGVPF